MSTSSHPPQLSGAASLTHTLVRRGVYQATTEASPLGILDLLLVAFLALAPLCLLSVRSWTISFVLVLIAIAGVQLIRSKQGFKLLKQHPAAVWVACALASPFLAVAIGELLRQRFQVNLLDGPSRALLAILLFVYLLEKRFDFVRLLEWSIPISIIVLSSLLLVHPYNYVNIPSGRFGTQAVDPLSLGQYATLLGFICLFTLNLYGQDRPLLKVLKLVGVVLALCISVGTESRSGWIAAPVLTLIWVLHVHKIRHPTKLFLAFAGVSLIGGVLYHFTPVVHERIALAASELIAYGGGTAHDTSTGLRISLLRIASLLFWENPLAGYGDAHYPALASIPAILEFRTDALEFALIHNGVHNEIMQSTLRSGVFGLVSSLLMYLVPAVVFYRGSLSRVASVRAAGVVGLCYIVAVFCFGLTTEVFNLKYTITFYALMVSTLAAQVLRPQPV